jgi:hypothetical protein
MPKSIVMREHEITSANILQVRAGTTGPCGGDAGHGCRTVFELEDAGGTDIHVDVLEHGVRIRLGGDCELETFIQALEWAAKTLREQSHPGTLVSDAAGEYIIRNSLGCEIARVVADSAGDALVDYAVSVSVLSARLREIGWRAELAGQPEEDIE